MLCEAVGEKLGCCIASGGSEFSQFLRTVEAKVASVLDVFT
jgi:hypothetical protein